MDSSEIKTYTDQSEQNKAQVNQNKILEEKVLRQIDDIKSTNSNVDLRWIAEAKTHIETGFMCLNRGIFQPTRIDGPLE